MSLFSNIWHQLCDFSRLVGLRDRLRCPSCGAVGTWKPHGGWLDGCDERKVRRWLCKWCGLYKGPEGTTWAAVGPTCWGLVIDLPGATTPKNAVEDHFDRPVNPWAG